MSEADQETTERERAQARRDRLRVLMDRLETALAEPSRRDPARWCSDVRDVVSDLRLALEDHAADTESSGGLFDEVIRQAPRLTNKVAELRGEHPQLLAAVAAMHASLGLEPGDETVTSVREQGIALLVKLVRHRHAGADLLYETYWVDVAVGD